MKKISIVLLIIGLMMIIATLFILNSSKNTVKSEWSVVSNNESNGLVSKLDINCNCSSYNTNNYIKDYFYAIDDSANKYWFLVPVEEQLTKTAYFMNEYNGIMNINYGDSNFKNIDDYILSYVTEYKNNYNKIHIRKNSINSNTIAINIKYINIEDGNYFEELIIYSHNLGDNYSYVKYQIQDQSFDNQFIEKVIKEFKKELNTAKYTNCEISNNQYNCIVNMNSIDKKIKFNVDSSKYILYSQTNYDNYQESFIINNDDSSNIQLLFGLSNLKEDIENNWFNDYKNEGVLINDKKIQKYSINLNNKYKAYYVIDLENDVVVVLNISSKNNVLDNIAKDFVNYVIY